MKKIGVTTHYTNSCNYGGCLQAYALCKVLNDKGFDAKQIRYTVKNKNNAKTIMKRIKNGAIIKRTIVKIFCYLNKIEGRIRKEDSNIGVLINAFSVFRDAIPHTDTIYNEETIVECNEFDYYITGSDQVWHVNNETDYLNSFYWLEFVKSARKISYAASIGVSSIPEHLYNKINNALSDYYAISVRQKHDKELLEQEISKLPSRDKEIMIMRYGLYNTKDYTQKEVADKLNISQSYISRIEKKVIKRIQSLLKI